MMCALPRAAFGQLRAAFVFDVAVRATAFFALAFALQWFLGARLGPRSGARAWPPSFTTTFLFIIIPVIWRLRGEGIPVHQQRLLTFLFSTACIAVAVISVAPNAALGAAIVLATAWLTFSSWKLYTASANGTLPLGPWLATIYPACAIVVASAPIKLALGIALWRPWWPGDNLITYIVGAVIALSAAGWDIGEAPYRKFLR
jgi:hypothetical protein